MTQQDNYTFKFNFTDEKTGRYFERVEPMWLPTADGKCQSLVVYETEPITVLASIPIERPVQELWNLAREKLSNVHRVTAQ